MRLVYGLGVLLCCSQLHAAEIGLIPSKDNTLYEHPGGIFSNGLGKFLFAGVTQQTAVLDFRRSVMMFDIAGALPAGSTINAASLTMRVSNAKVGLLQSFSLHRALQDWGEAGSNAGEPGGQGTFALPGDATWLHTFFDSNTWDNPGGDFDDTASALTFIGGTGLYTWDSAGLASDVQSWLDDSATNFGWLLRGAEVSIGSARRFNSRENQLDPPLLVIDFTPPSPDFGGCCLADGTCAVLEEGDCLAQQGAFAGAGATCFPNPCPQPTGACCLLDDSCLQITLAECLDSGFAFLGGLTSCETESCDGFCTELVHCADNDLDGIRDDACVWWDCNVFSQCAGVDIGYADMGGNNGECPPDGTADANDRFHALNCFSNQDTLGKPVYPCENEPPGAFNVDVAGLGAPCLPDGVCDANDAFAAVNAFSDNTTCLCTPGPDPVFGPAKIRRRQR